MQKVQRIEKTAFEHLKWFFISLFESMDVIKGYSFNLDPDV